MCAISLSKQCCANVDGGASDTCPEPTASKNLQQRCVWRRLFLWWRAIGGPRSLSLSLCLSRLACFLSRLACCLSRLACRSPSSFCFRGLFLCRQSPQFCQPICGQFIGTQHVLGGLLRTNAAE